MKLPFKLDHKQVYLFGLILLVSGMPVSRFLSSFSQVLLLSNWLLEGDFRNKWRMIKNQTSLWCFIGLYLLLVLGIAWTEDFEYAIRDLRIKLPMLWLPILFASSPILEKKQYHLVLHFFVGAVMLATFCSMVVYLGWTHRQVHEVRDISIFESHIRFSLMIVLSILYLFYVIFRKDKPAVLWPYLLVLPWLLFFLFLLQSFTGIIIAAILAFSALSWVLLSHRPVWIKLIFLTVVSGWCIGILYLFADEWNKFNYVKKIDFKSLPTGTVGGRGYWHDTTVKQTENGNPVWLYICEWEMRKEWNRRNWRSFDSLDYKGNKLSFTLIRYLASRGYPRDSAGVWMLSEQDIHNIDEGCPNYLYCNSSGIRNRIHELIWEVNQALLKENPTGHSLSMRYEFWKTAWHIIRQHPICGVGTGDVDAAFRKQYQDDRSALTQKWRLRAHNQFLEIAVAVGFSGLLLFLLGFYTPFIFSQRHSWFFIFFMLIQFLSFFNEDTLETAAGVTFCIFFTQFIYKHEVHNL